MIGILYNAIMHNMEFGQAYCKDLLKRILQKNILHFCYMYSIFYELLKFNEFMEILNQKMILKLIKPRNGVRAIFGLRPSSEGSVPGPI
jgi:hypothetical protein